MSRQLLLDTVAISALAEGEVCLTALLREDDRLFLSVISVGEFAFGIRESRHRKKATEWLGELTASYPVMDVTMATVTWYAEIRQQLKKKGRPIPANDIWIAAQAKEHALALVSRDRHFDYVDGLRRLIW